MVLVQGLGMVDHQIPYFFQLLCSKISRYGICLGNVIHFEWIILDQLIYFPGITHYFLDGLKSLVAGVLTITPYIDHKLMVFGNELRSNFMQRKLGSKLFQFLQIIAIS